MDTIMAPLTPVKISAVIMLRISGDLSGVWDFFDVKAEKIEPRKAKKTLFKSKSNTLVRDEVLLTYFKAPGSYTGEDVLEVSFHGNPIIVHMFMKDLSSIGVRLAEPGEFTRRAYYNGKLSLSQAEAVNALIQAPTIQGVGVAQQALYGELDNIFIKTRSELLECLSVIEAVIDFAEELHETEELKYEELIKKAVTSVQALVDTYEAAQRTIYGVSVVIAGAPNAGKSTLFNKLLGKERAIVSDEAGTTRDTLTEGVYTGGVHFSLTDTAGLRESSSVAEKAGMERARNALDKADLVIVLIDRGSEISAESRELLELTSQQERIVVGTKADLGRRTELKTDLDISASKGHNMDKFQGLLASKVAQLTENYSSGPVLMAEQQKVECDICLEELKKLQTDLSLDLKAYHLRVALEALNRSQGIDVAEEVLDNLFAKFCIGK